ncbi:MAG TPA: hypothetical protein VGR44_04470 [Methylomirabilota bacterium]|jgi:hypothetical protein|nr:hypothetical protein [Methylomirabilota bacterium]
MDGSVAWGSEAIQETVVQGVAQLFAYVALVVAVLLLFSLALLVTQAVRRRRFYCAPSGLDVEVQFDERGLPGMRRSVGVLSCSAFEPPNAVRCSRRCLDEDVRRLWQSWPALPLRREP